MSACEYVHMEAPGVELQKVMSCTVWVLGTELGSFGRTQVFFVADPSLSLLCSAFFSPLHNILS